MNPYVLVAFMLLIAPCAVFIADDADGLDLYDVTFHIQGGGTQTVKYTNQAHPPDVEGVLFWTMTDPGAVDTEGIAVVNASDVWNPNRNYRHDLDLYPVRAWPATIGPPSASPPPWGRCWARSSPWWYPVISPFLNCPARK